ncbi:DUF1616 domain-containing protein [Halorientalis salina]|uniref:DUF1616 domain-containing protein n=1 Tax=Halorientalis salina TaxID=2932266 RepID=UPI0010AD2C23|nr:DUF1616 domain-containing protein [Halorientalis salina]
MFPFGRWYSDLTVVVCLTAVAVVMVISDVPGWLRIGFVVPLVTVLPGYAFIGLLYPRTERASPRVFDETEGGLSESIPTKEGIDTVERIVLAVLSSLILVPAVVLGTNFTPWGITVEPILAGLAGLTGVLVLGTAVRRLRVPSSQRYAPSFSFLSTLLYTRSTPTFGSTGSSPYPFNIALVIAIVLFASSLGYAAVNPPTGDGFTELYIETGDVTGETESMYPSQFAAGETRALPVTVANRENEETAYGLVVLQQRVNRTDTDERVVETDRITQQRFTLDQGENWSQPMSVSPSMSGSDLRLVLLLYRGDIPTDPSIDTAYRVLRLPIDVDGGGGS